MPYIHAVLGSPGLAGFWPLDDAVGSSSARDASGVGNPMSLLGASPPVLGNASLLREDPPLARPCAVFSGAGRFGTSVSCVGALASGPSGNKTLEAWAQTGISVGEAILSRLNCAIYSWFGNPCYYDGANIFNAGGQFSDKKVHHIVCTIVPGGAANTTSMWVDGKVIWTAASANSDSTLTAHAWAIGNEPNGTQPWTGSIQYPAVYTGLLSPHRIRQHWRIGMGYEGRENGLSEILFTPNGQCPQQGSFDIKNGYAIYYSDLQTQGGIVTADPGYRDTLRSSGYFTESVAP